jgi:RNA polymerase sigma-70 factor (ECF subfamily)
MDILRSYGGEQPDFDEAAPLTDTELAALVRSGDNDAFAELWERLERPVAHVANQSSADHNNRDDFVQDAAEKLLRDLQKNERDFDNPSGARNYAASITKRNIVDSWRRTQRRPEELTDEFYDSTGTPYESAEDIALQNMQRQEVLGAIQIALDSLPPDRGEAFTATYIREDETRQEYAKRIGSNVTTVGTRVHRAKDSLRQDENLRRTLDQLEA